jgi:hypothetical protein
VTLAGCTPGGDDSGEPTASINNLASGTSVPVGEAVIVDAQGDDVGGSGVVRLDLLVDGETRDTYSSDEPQPVIAAQLSFTPATEGAVSVSVVAFREDGTASNPATIALQVVGVTTEPPAEDEGAAEADAEAESQDAEPVSDTRQPLTGRPTIDLNLRSGVSPDCTPLGVWHAGEVGELVARIDNVDGSGHWYKTTFLGSGVVAYAYAGESGENFDLHGPDDDLPREPARGCLAEGGSASGSGDPTGADGSLCGDGVCQSGESPLWCGDCTGIVCGNNIVDVGEACDGIWGCALNQACSADCSACNVGVCGDNLINQPGELCDGTAGCLLGGTCSSDCTQCVAPPPPACGDGIVQILEQCDPPHGGTGLCTPALTGQQICNNVCLYITCP